MVAEHFDVVVVGVGTGRQRGRAGPRPRRRPGGALGQGRLPPRQGMWRRGGAARRRRAARPRPGTGARHRAGGRHGGGGPLGPARAAAVLRGDRLPRARNRRPPARPRRMAGRQGPRRRGQGGDRTRRSGGRPRRRFCPHGPARRGTRRRSAPAGGRGHRGRRGHQPGRRRGRARRPTAGAVGLRRPGVPRGARRPPPHRVVGTPSPAASSPVTAGCSRGPTVAPTPGWASAPCRTGAPAPERCASCRNSSNTSAASGSCQIPGTVPGRDGSGAGSRWGWWAPPRPPARCCSPATRPDS